MVEHTHKNKNRITTKRNNQQLVGLRTPLQIHSRQSSNIRRSTPKLTNGTLDRKNTNNKQRTRSNSTTKNARLRIKTSIRPTTHNTKQTHTNTKQRRSTQIPRTTRNKKHRNNTTKHTLQPTRKLLHNIRRHDTKSRSMVTLRTMELPKSIHMDRTKKQTTNTSNRNNETKTQLHKRTSTTNL